jgi:hypothetical protein
MLLKERAKRTIHNFSAGFIYAGLLLTGCYQGSHKPEAEADTKPKTIEKTTMDMYPALTSYINEVANDTAALSQDRKALLNEAASYIRNKQADGKRAELIFICTHNSRRSHMSQLWAATMAAYTGKAEAFASYSGGTEATAFNPRAVSAMEKAGFTITRMDEEENPVYEVQYAPDAPRMLCYSKKYDAAENPRTGFAAIMTCSQADEACPVVSGAEARIPVMYEDPKAFDGTSREAEAYEERCRQIATEMLYMMGQV